MKKKVNTIFIIILILFILPFYVFFITSQNDSSILENRTLVKHEMFNLGKFWNSEYQSNLESALGDQMLLQEPIKKRLLITRQKMVAFLNKIIFSFSNNSKKYYVAIGNDMYVLNEDDYIISKPKFSNINKKSFAFFNNINLEDKYLYYIESDSSVNFVLNNSGKYYNYISSNLNVKASDKLSVPNYNTYKNYYYKTDHHWNRNAHYKAYLSIAKLLKYQPIIKDIGDKEYNVFFNGSKARSSARFDINEKFKVNVYNDYKKGTIYINGEEGSYGDKKKYDLGKYENEYLTNHYGLYYGGDYPEIVFDLKDDSKENLLIISNSYSNPINELIASSFNKTFILDLRSYDSIDLNKYIEDNKINKVLILGDIRLFGDSYFSRIKLK